MISDEASSSTCCRFLIHKLQGNCGFLSYMSPVNGYRMQQWCTLHRKKKMNYIWLIAYIFLVPDKKNAFITTNGSNCLTRKMRSTHRKIQRS